MSKIQEDLDTIEKMIALGNLDYGEREDVEEMREALSRSGARALPAKRRQWLKVTLASREKDAEESRRRQAAKTSPSKVELKVGRLPLDPPGRYPHIRYKDEQP